MPNTALTSVVTTGRTAGCPHCPPHAIRKTVRRRKGWPRAAPEGGGRRRSGKVPRGAANDVDGRFPVRQDGFPHRVRRCGEAGVRRVIFVHVPAQRQPVQHDGFPLSDGQRAILSAQYVELIEVREGLQLVPMLHL